VCWTQNVLLVGCLGRQWVVHFLDGGGSQVMPCATAVNSYNRMGSGQAQLVQF
jgi:hypothetical protein